MANADGPDADGPMSRALPCRRGLDPDGPAGDGAAAAAIADPDARPVGPASADPDATWIADVPPDVPPVADPALVADAIAKLVLPKFSLVQFLLFLAKPETKLGVWFQLFVKPNSN